jgi:hypothetical protein
VRKQFPRGGQLLVGDALVPVIQGKQQHLHELAVQLAPLIEPSRLHHFTRPKGRAGNHGDRRKEVFYELTGLGYSLIFPSMGVEALKSAASQNRGLVLGAFFACFDLGVALAGPSAGLVARTFGLSTVFLTAASLAMLACLLLLSHVSFSHKGPIDT